MVLKKAIIRLGRKMCFENPHTIYQVNNGYVFDDTFYPTIEEMSGDFLKKTKDYFGEGL